MATRQELCSYCVSAFGRARNRKWVSMSGVRDSIGKRVFALLPLAFVLGLLVAAGCSDEDKSFTFPEYPPIPVDNWFFGIWGLHENHIFVVGQPGLIYHFDGEWHREQSPTTTALTDVWGDDAGAVYATGYDGVILRRNAGGTWSKMESGTTEHLYAVGRYQGTVMATGFKGTLLKLNGQSWIKAPELVYRRDDNNVIEDTLIISEDIESLTAVTHHAIGGSEGTLLMTDILADWQLRPIPDQEWVTAAASNELDPFGNFVATDNGRLYQLLETGTNQLVWSERYSPAREATVYGIYSDEDNAVWAVTNDGRINRVEYPHMGIDSFTALYEDQSMVFFDIWGSDSANVYAVGIHGCVLHYHEVGGELGWHPVELPDLPETGSGKSQAFDKFGRPVHR
jgi:hypothetical protein